MPHDAVIIGGSYAGLSAALQLVRARRRVLVIDDGRPRNRYAARAHGVLANDGRPGAEIAATARAQVAAYPTAAFRMAEAVDVARVDGGFSVVFADGTRTTGRRLLLSHGVEDVLVDIPGVKERWGRTALHCPWCHGYEVGGGPIGVLGRGEMAAHYAATVAEWGDVTLFLDLDNALSPENARLLYRRGVTIEPTPIARLEGEAPTLTGARLVDGRFVPLKALFVGAAVRIACPFAETLGCDMTDTPLGRIVKVDATQQTTQPGVFAAGDLARAASNITLSTSDGLTAGHALFRSLVEEETA
ncbi:NAD(P)/FAD-dependent oxidoreductase [Brevundimonas sp. SORGH_AS_0993]|uniref:NAD(P)/FAD-dependent oxidoreductase n=1 Tax=Brevundimonas sp. SORGH_AS_0993 TaxID=3041794 RepID=UPI002786995B|nr:NAD(P)/FAD-dependent oxidoreductase [Brevundimonas sp. SORGH_AS_0993]MDQ1154915.1 thioredoxin reductase [Brevundimonas sp. SORGH_AS_0993]